MSSASGNDIIPRVLPKSWVARPVHPPPPHSPLGSNGNGESFATATQGSSDLLTALPGSFPPLFGDLWRILTEARRLRSYIYRVECIFQNIALKRYDVTYIYKLYKIYSMDKNAVSDMIRQLRDHRKRQNLSQVHLGKLLGAPQSQITRIECGGSDIRLSTLLEMARALGLEPVLIPKPLLPAVRHLLAREQAGSESPATAPPRRLLGSEPEDTNAEVG
jgi:transcriptional regulator with XRE-family HTH domain